MNIGDLVLYSERFLGTSLVAMILSQENLGPTDYNFYKILLSDGRQLIIADTRLRPVNFQENV